MKNTDIRQLRHQDLSAELFTAFNRHQEITQCWKRAENLWKLEPHNDTRDWNETQRYYLLLDLHKTIGMGGNVSGLFEGERLIGFFSVESFRFGMQQDYVQLSHFHISSESRRQGYGRMLFGHACRAARDFGAKKLYISSLCSPHTITFYSRMGCVEAEEYNQLIASREPGSIQLEFDLVNAHQ